MKVEQIISLFEKRGIKPIVRFSNAGIVCGLPVGGGRAVFSLVPIADESIPRFVQYLIDEQLKLMKPKTEWEE